MHPVTEQNRQPEVVIDWTQWQGDASGTQLLQWIRSNPLPSSVHVYIGSVGKKRLQSALLSLGCTVTTRTKLPIPA